MSTGNGQGELRVNLRQDMAAYDRSPPLLRLALASAPYDYGAKHALDRWNSARLALGVKAARPYLADIVAGLMRVDPRSAAEAYGPLHPEARG